MNERLDDIIKQMEKKYGSGALWQGENAPDRSTDAISTGSPNLDRATGIGGIPRGRMIEIYGPESSGKSTLSIHIMAEAQKQGLPTAYIDVEQAFDAPYAGNCGLDINQLLVSQPDSAEMALGITESLVDTGNIGLIVVDSVAALVPQEEIEKDLDEATVALQARIMSKALRKLTPKAAHTNAAVVFINQLRDNINNTYGGERSVTPGGRALKFYSSMRVELRASHQIKERDQPVGNHVRARVRKNKLGAPFRTADLAIIYGEGISREMEIIEHGLEANVITRKGAHFYYEGRAIGLGAERLRRNLKQEPELAQAIITALNHTGTDEQPED